MLYWIRSEASDGELWLVAGLCNAMLWLFFTFPMFYRMIFCPLGGEPFWRRMVQQPGLGLILVIILIAGGPFMLYVGLASVPILLLLYFVRGCARILLKP